MNQRITINRGREAGNILLETLTMGKKKVQPLL